MQDEKCLDAARVDALADFVKRMALVGQSEKFEAICVGIEVGAAKDAVGFAGAGDDVGEDRFAAENLADFSEQVSFLIGEAPRGDDGDLLGAKFFQLRGAG